MWVEIGKMVYYTFRGEFTVPKNYYFAASKGVGLSLQKLLADPAKLNKGLIDNWDSHCKSKITETDDILLEVKLLAHLNPGRAGCGAREHDLPQPAIWNS
jgi:hypothetical protein